MNKCTCQCLEIVENTLVHSVREINNGNHQAKKNVGHYLGFIYLDKFLKQDFES